MYDLKNELDKIITFLTLVDCSATNDKYRQHLNLSKNDIKHHNKFLHQYRQVTTGHNRPTLIEIKAPELPKVINEVQTKNLDISFGEIDSFEKLETFLYLVQTGAHINKYRNILGIKESIKSHLGRLELYKEIASRKYNLKHIPTFNKIGEVQDKCLIIIASTGQVNPYNSDKIKVKAGKKSVGEFNKISFPHDILVRSDNGPGINFGKWNRCWKDNQSYKYYMLLHDDCFEFQPGWLDKMIEIIEGNKLIGAVCHQIYGPGAEENTYQGMRCGKFDSVSVKDVPIIYSELRKAFTNPVFVNVMGGEQILTTNEVMQKIDRLGGMPEPPTPNLGGLYERIFSGYITSLGYLIKDCRVEGKPPFKHHLIS